jgi:hypothetical protein
VIFYVGGAFLYDAWRTLYRDPRRARRMKEASNSRRT